MQRLEVSGAVRSIYGSLGVKRLTVLLIALSDILKKDVPCIVHVQEYLKVA